MNLEEATRIVLEEQRMYLRGRMSQDRITEISTLYPRAIPDWNRMKLNIQVRKTKLAKKVKDILLASKNKSNGCKRFRPGKVNSTLKTLKKQLGKAKKRFVTQGIDNLLTWIEFMNEICRPIGVMWAELE